MKQMKSIKLMTGISLCAVLPACQPAAEKTPSLPNVIYMLADDLGYGDLSCYGQTHFQTPNIDRLAREGMLFTQHYAGCTVCAPSRSSLLTGQTTGHTPVRGNKSWEPEGQWPMPAESVTLAELLKEAGYATGCFGKWGLGFTGTSGDPNSQGFDEFYGYNCQSLAHNYYPGHLWHNQDKIVLEGNAGDGFETYAPGLIHQQALQFMEANKDKPFFMYYPSPIPHAELLLPNEEMEPFRGKYLPEKSYQGAEPSDDRFRLGAYGSQDECHAAFAAMVSLLDRQVGEILDKLEELGLAENTIVIFTSDNGPHLEGGADPDYFDSNGPLRGYKRDLYEGGIREPMLVRWPGKVQAGSHSDHISAFWDVMPTLTELAGLESPQNIDGISFLPTLLGIEGQQEHDYLYWEFHEMGGRQAIRQGNWKLVVTQVSNLENTKVELFDLETDLGEETDLAQQEPEVVERLFGLLSQARTPSEVFDFQAATVIR
ncbi:arylsulfatase [Gaoshiqia sediminis]|uniref:Arylsulfatase n=1 Tax=Gaoshiqia sediminis TaxID=2986998 RepID=A0AA41Y8I4_9BACT|nr:arylsulfatase [Gaoshiqia sediminis]MCW0483142.1 arylsulfatase [Gaoshiqia sediminis]